MISMPFQIEFRGKKTRYGRADRPTDRPSYKDTWTHLKKTKFLNPWFIADAIHKKMGFGRIVDQNSDKKRWVQSTVYVE